LTLDNRPLFVISDLHLGSGSARDVFADSQKKEMLFQFLDMVEKEDARLIVLGDLMDLWRFRIKGIVNSHGDIFDRLYELDASYIPGNHDLAVSYLAEKGFLEHPFLNSPLEPVTYLIGDKKFSFLHGHEIDTVSRGINPSIGRALGLTALPIEHIKGKQVFSSEKINEMVLEIKASFLTLTSQIRWHMLKFWSEITTPMSYLELLDNLKNIRSRKMIDLFMHQKQNTDHDIVVSAHTHRAGNYSNWYYNSGSWTDINQNFLKILPSGIIEICNWTKSGPAIIS